MPVDNVLLKTKERATRVGSVKGTFADIIVVVAAVTETVCNKRL